MKLNNKGFTLIELLAVIVILAVVMGIAANSVITSMNNSRKGSLQDNALIVQEAFNTGYVESQVIGATTILGVSLETLKTGTPQTLTSTTLTTLNISNKDIDADNSYVRFESSTERFEVCLTSAGSNGKFHVRNAESTQATTIYGEGSTAKTIPSGKMFWCTERFNGTSSLKSWT